MTEWERGQLLRINRSAQRLWRQGGIALSVDAHQLGIHLACVADRQNRRYRPGILWHVRLQRRLAFIERSWDQVWGYLPANFFTEEIEMKDRVAIMLFKLNSDFVSTGCDSDKPERINISILSGCCHLWTLRDHKTKNKIETSLNLFSLFVSWGLSFHDTQTQISKTQTPRNK